MKQFLKELFDSNSSQRISNNNTLTRSQGLNHLGLYSSHLQYTKRQSNAGSQQNIAGSP